MSLCTLQKLVNEFLIFLKGHTKTLPSEIITQLILQKLFCAMITRISRNPARHNSSGIFWRNDKMAIAQIDPWKHAQKTVRKHRATTKLRNHPQNNSPRVISRNRLRQFRAILQKIILRGPKKGVITKGVFSLEESLESLRSLEFLEDGPLLLCFPQSGGSPKSLESLNSILFQKTPFSEPEFLNHFFRARNVF